MNLDDILSGLNFSNVTNPFVFEATNVDGLIKFLKTIDWSERWLICLMTFHVLTLIFIFLTRRCSNIQIATFLSLLGLCYSSEKLNELGAKYWRSFAIEQYFDSNGLFIAVVFSAPIILNCTLIVILWLYESYLLLIKIVKIKKKHNIARTENHKKQELQQEKTDNVQAKSSDDKKKS